MNEPEIGTYCDAVGSRHRLVVRRTAEGDWRVLDVDVTSGTAHIVDALTGEQDGQSAGRGDRPRLPDHG